MRTVDYSEILHGSAALAGMRPDDLGPPEFALFRTFHDRRLQVAWEIHRWPDLCPIEWRAYRPLWAASTTYAAGDECYDRASDTYVQAIQASTGEAPTTAGVVNLAYWATCATAYAAADRISGTAYAVGEQFREPTTGAYYQVHTAHTAGESLDLTQVGVLTPFDKYVAWEQTGQTAIAEFLQATNKDPRLSTQTVAYPFWLSAAGAQFAAGAPTALYLYFRIRRPTLLGDAWDADTVYTAGQQVYFAATAGAPGNFYTANASPLNPAAGESPATDAPQWTRVDLPYFLRGYLIEGGYADWLVSEGEHAAASGHNEFATEFLHLEVDKLQRQQHQTRRLMAA